MYDFNMYTVSIYYSFKRIHNMFLILTENAGPLVVDGVSVAGSRTTAAAAIDSLKSAPTPAI